MTLPEIIAAWMVVAILGYVVCAFTYAAVQRRIHIWRIERLRDQSSESMKVLDIRRFKVGEIVKHLNGKDDVTYHCIVSMNEAGSSIGISAPLSDKEVEKLRKKGKL